MCGTFIKVHKVSAGNSGHLKTLDTWYIYLSNGLIFWLKKLGSYKHLPLGYIQTKNEL